MAAEAMQEACSAPCSCGPVAKTPVCFATILSCLAAGKPVSSMEEALAILAKHGKRSKKDKNHKKEKKDKKEKHSKHKHKHKHKS